MKDFYLEWQATRKQQKNDLAFVNAFLNKEKESLCMLDDGYSHEQLVMLLDLFQHIPTDHFLQFICNIKELPKFDTSDVSQFSDFEKGAIIVPQILEFYPNGINFTELGEKLIGSKEKEANRKYGENHASLASLMSLAMIKKQHRKLVFPTSLGHFLIDYNMEEKNKLLKAMLLRCPFVQAMVKIAIIGCGNYGSLMSDLTATTARRRRQSVRHIMEFILSDTDKEDCYLRIDWTV